MGPAGTSGAAGDSPIRRVLMIGVRQELHARLEPLLRRRSFDADRVPAGSGTLLLLQSIAFDVLVLALPMEETLLDQILTEIRRPEAPCRRSALILAAAPEEMARAREVEGGGGFTQVLSTEADDGEVQQLIAALLRVAPRLSVRIPIRLEVQLEGGAALVMSQTENVSLGGMLVRVQRKLPDRVTVRFQLLIPGERQRITGTGEVVRTVVDERGRARAVGVRFDRFEERGHRLLEAFLQDRIGRGS